MSKRIRLIVIVGPTASGKSELAVHTAKKIGGEIISADSRQVYRGLDVGTAKVKGKWKKIEMRLHKSIIASPVESGMKQPHSHSDIRGIAAPRQVGARNDDKTFVYKNIPHHCIDFVSPKRTYTVAKFKECAKTAIVDIESRGKVPIVVGGTGFWIDVLVYDMELPQAPPNPLLRRELGKKSSGQLVAMLKKIDPARAKTIEAKNPRRLIRAIEIATALGWVPKIKKRHPYAALWIGLNPSSSILEKRFKKRANTMVPRALVAEARRLLQNNVPRRQIREFGFEYRLALNYLEKEISREEFMEQFLVATRRYAKRQMTWWKKNRDIRWFPNSHGIMGYTGRLLKKLA